MCLYVAELEERPENSFEEFRKYLKIAKEDIIVYKILLKTLDNRLQSIYYDMQYEVGYEYYQNEINLKDRFGLDVYLHRTRKYHRTKKYHLVVEKGLHSYKNKAHTRSRIKSPFLVLCKFIIPKGAYYAEGINNNDAAYEGFVSDRITFDKICV